MKQLFFEKIDKTAKLQQESLKRKLGKAQIKNIKKETGGITKETFRYKNDSKVMLWTTLHR